ncbi:phage virion morphogenesis protein [Kiloniella laminariae]|uniref:Phage virion morphogenesis protein n=1 Tax=Kiloniella laminariae TaxID=454162 RepID=A0ABT4LKR7_9PROT|nr:phage virion morphogenesis protein [Kiloniella laminariae]MCZ4281704.1 phage virion morphogenesis protein [Kiloniella laminariae]
MSDDLIQGLEKFDSWMEQVIETLSPARRRSLFRDIARDLRSRNQKRITAQQDPDGSSWEPRKTVRPAAGKSRTGQIRKKKKMMLGLRSARRLKFTASPDSADIGFAGRTARIAMVHHFGGMDLVDQDGTTKVRYPVRQLLGFSPDDRDAVRDRILSTISQAFK